MLEKEPRSPGTRPAATPGSSTPGSTTRPAASRHARHGRGARRCATSPREHGIPVEICGKLVVATARSRSRRCPAARAAARQRRPVAADLGGGGARVRAVRLLRRRPCGSRRPASSTTAGCATCWPTLIGEDGGEVRLGAEIVGIERAFRRRDGAHDRDGARSRADGFVNCAGLHVGPAGPAGRARDRRCGSCRSAASTSSSRRTAEHLVTRADLPGAGPDAAVPRRAPDPDDRRRGARRSERGAGAGPGGLHLARRRPRATSPTRLRWPGLWRLGRQYWRHRRSRGAPVAVAGAFLASLRELVPALPDDCLVPAPAGVRAQALRRDGSLVDDFSTNAASGRSTCSTRRRPAATAALEIAEHLVAHVDAVTR